nr:LysR substrate-binding domain-containing protein [Nocardioides panaciterrulae]
MHSQRILAAIRAAESDLAALTSSGTSVVRLAAFPSSCATVVPAAMAGMRRAFPNIEIQLVQAEPPEARALVRRGDVEVALSYRFSDAPERVPDGEGGAGLHQREVLVEDMHLIVPLDDPAASHRLVDLAQLAEATFLLASPNFEDRLRRAAAAAGFTPKVVRMADDYVAMQALVASGFGVAWVPDLALRAHRDPRVVSRSLVGWPQRHIGVEAWPDLLRVEPVRAMVDHLSAAGAALRRR